MYIGKIVLLLNFLAFKLFYYLFHVHVCVSMCAHVEDRGHQVDLGAGRLTQVVRFGGKRLYLLSHFTGDIMLLF